MTGDRLAQVEPWMRESLAAALESAGCPAGTATGLANEARIEWTEPWPGADGEWLLQLRGCGAGFADPDDRDEWNGAVEQVARRVADDNAEANDRLGRGELQAQPYWLLPGRPARRS